MCSKWQPVFLHRQVGVETPCSKRLGFPIWKLISLKSSPVELPGGLINLKITIWRIHTDLLPQKAPCSLSCKGSLMLHWGWNPECYPSHRRCKGQLGYFLDFLQPTDSNFPLWDSPPNLRHVTGVFNCLKTYPWSKKNVRISATQKLVIFLK